MVKKLIFNSVTVTTKFVAIAEEKEA